MAEPESRPPADLAISEIDEEEKEKELKHLDFVRVATIYVVVCCSMIYEYAKENSGPLRPGVRTVEGTVKAVIGPVCEKFRDVPFHLLGFVDRKVDQSITELDHHMPALVKLASTQAWAAAHSASQLAKDLTHEVHETGFIETASKIARAAYVKYEPAANELYAAYEPVAEHYAVTAWRVLNGLPLLGQAAHIMVPTVTHWAEKYNQALTFWADRGYTVSYYLPYVPIERIAKTFGAHGGPTASVAAPRGHICIG